jgi:hypothetical protein
MLRTTYTIRGYGPGFEAEVARFTGAEDEVRTIADELARSYGDDLYAVAVTKEEDAEDIVYVTHDDSSRNPSRR